MYVYLINGVIFLSGIFGLMNAFAFLRYVQSYKAKVQLQHFFFLAVSGAAAVLFVVVLALTYAGR